MKKAIIHISDLHISLHQDLKKRPVKDIKSFLTTNSADELVKQYIVQFCKYVNDKFSDCTFYLLITGDITNVADEQEFITAFDILEMMISELKLEKENVLLIPGDHDVNRDDNKQAFKIGLEEGLTKNAFDYNLEKYSRFGVFYKKLFNEDFDAEKSIVKHIEIQPENLLLVGLNSNFFLLIMKEDWEV